MSHILTGFAALASHGLQQHRTDESVDNPFQRHWSAQATAGACAFNMCCVLRSTVLPHILTSRHCPIKPCPSEPTIRFLTVSRRKFATTKARAIHLLAMKCLFASHDCTPSSCIGADESVHNALCRLRQVDNTVRGQVSPRSQLHVEAMTRCTCMGV